MVIYRILQRYTDICFRFGADHATLNKNKIFAHIHVSNIFLAVSCNTYFCTTYLCLCKNWNKFLLSGVCVCLFVCKWAEFVLFQVPIQWFSSPTSVFGLLFLLNRVKVVHYAYEIVCKKKNQRQNQVTHTLYWYWSSFFCIACANKNHERKISFIFSTFIHSFTQALKRWLQCACRNKTNEIMSPPLQIQHMRRQYILKKYMS